MDSHKNLPVMKMKYNQNQIRKSGSLSILVTISILVSISFFSGMAMADSGEDTSIGGVRAVEKDGCMFLGSDFIEVGILPNVALEQMSRLQLIFLE